MIGLTLVLGTLGYYGLNAKSEQNRQFARLMLGVVCLSAIMLTLMGGVHGAID